MDNTFAFIALAAVAIGIAWYLSSLRRKKLGAWAESNGLRFDPKADGSFDDRFPAFNCLRVGHTRRAYNVSEGSRSGRALVAFDYRYVIGHGKQRQVHSFSAIVLGSAVPLKPLRIRSENVFDKVGEFFGADDIDFESAEFSRAFHVKSSDKRWAYDVLHQRTIEFLLSMPRFSMQFGGREVIVWRSRRFRPEVFDQAIAVAEGVLDRLPGYVIREGGGT
jgi:hypothetical protein